jgi:NADPH:quinone reductase-like Zn-dependent oxidoreductase
MKAAQINAYGGKEVVEINENAPMPQLSVGQVLVEVRAAGINPVDWKIREGYMKEGAPLEFPATLGGDFSGVVKETAVDVVNFEAGEEVYGTALALGGGSGAFAEVAASSAKSINHKPKNISHEEAAALPLTGVSALQALFEHMNLQRGQKILIHGGAGGIGTVAIQIAKHLGAYVATTAGADDVEYVKGLGADEVIDYKTQKFEDVVSDYNAVFDTVGGETNARSFNVLKKGGIIVSMLEEPNTELMEKHGVSAISQFTQITSERLSRLTELVEQGVITVHVEKTFALGEAADALEHLKTGHSRGKIVLRIK